MTDSNFKFRATRFLTAGRVMIFYLGSLVVLMLTSRLTKTLSSEVADLASIFFAFILTFLLVYLFTRWEKLRLADVGVIPRTRTVQRFVAGYVIGLSMAVIQALAVFSFGHLHLTIVPSISAQQIILPLSLYFFVGCREELAFRSYSLRSLAYAFSPLIALLSITVIFVLEHVMAGMTWKMALIGSGMGGVLFGLAALKTKGLALSLGLHSAFNFGQWLVGFKNRPGVWNAVVEKGYERETENISLAAFVLVTLLVIIGVVLFYKRESTQQKKLPLKLPSQILTGRQTNNHHQ
jgi:membrane protease YdiL (CAAX protease family)